MSSPVVRFDHTGPITWRYSQERIVCFRMVLLLLVMKRRDRISAPPWANPAHILPIDSTRLTQPGMTWQRRTA